MLITLQLLVALIGLLVYALSANTRNQTLGLVAYGAGLLAFLMNIGPTIQKLFPGAGG